MCGFLGLINKKASHLPRETFGNLLQLIEHRGPDVSDVWHSENIYFGHCRLAILDLNERSKQPMWDDTGRYVLIYNGEIYNAKSIKNKLLEKGHNFRTESDSEVLLYALIEWDVSALDVINGMFAFSFYDTKTKNILLARDRYGIKPLYYCINETFIMFSSEQKTIKKFLGDKIEMDKEALYEYLNFQNIFSDRTLDKRIKILSPGHYMKWNSSNMESPVPTEFWDFDFVEDSSIASQEQVEENLKYLFEKSLRDQLVSDVPIGCNLSGGVDSSLITWFAKNINNKIESFTIGIDPEYLEQEEKDFDETSAAKKFANLINIPNSVNFLKPQDIENCLDSLVWHQEEPRVGQSYPNYYLAKLAREKVKVILSGTGGDELFAGYPWRYQQIISSKNFDEFICSYLAFWRRFGDKDSINNLAKPLLSSVDKDLPEEIFRNIMQKQKGKMGNAYGNVNAALYFDAKTFLHGLLNVEDKLSMAFGLESRVPFLNNDLVEFAQTVPVKFKTSIFCDVNMQKINGKLNSKIFTDNNENGKIILRSLATKLTGVNFIETPKKGFSMPDSTWFRSYNFKWIKGVLSNKNSPLYNFINYQETMLRIDKHHNQVSNERLLIWSLIYLDSYLRANL